VSAQPITLTDVEQLAADRLDPDWYQYFAGGPAGQEPSARSSGTLPRSPAGSCGSGCSVESRA
jgi:hypothetical protein